MNILKKLLIARDLSTALAERDIVKASKCTCTLDEIRLNDGCQCAKGRRLKVIQAKIDSLLEELR